MDTSQQSPSLFAQMVDKLRNKSEEELKMLYLKIFAQDIKKEWTSITNEADFKNSAEEDIIKKILQKRYNQ